MFKLTNLLIVDDDDTLVRVFTRLAKDRNWSNVVARSGTEAIEAFSRQPFEVALVDIKLPGMSGIQVLEYAKHNHISAEIILITGVGSIESAVAAMKTGAYDYLTKPFDDIVRVSLLFV
ncbi:MAG: response regulator [Deltaproteobacteria bacterium]|nr:response regulator [Deltaproteobacteria bacterium]